MQIYYDFSLKCKEINEIIFHEDSKLEIIGQDLFSSFHIKSISILKTVTIIIEYARLLDGGKLL